MTLLDVTKSPELRAAILTLRSVPRELRLEMYKRTREQIGGTWKTMLTSNATTEMERSVLVKGARVRTGTDGFTLLAATSKRPLSGGLIPSFEWAGVEFGARTRREQVSMTSRRGKRFTRTQIINRQFRGRQQEGKVAMDAASATGTKLVAAWVRIVVEVVADAAGGEVIG